MSVTFYAAKRIQDPEFGVIIAQHEDSEIELNVANSNAALLLQAIRIDTEELVGDLSINQARSIADAIEENPHNVRPYSESRGDKGCRIIDMGLSMDRLRNYANVLRLLANEAELIEAEFIAYA